MNSFFRQSAWMVIATTASGVFMYAVHIPAVAKMPETEYGLFAALLQVLNLMLIPSLGLQMVFTHQTAAAVQPELRQQLARTARTLLLWTFGVWVSASLVIFLFRNVITDEWRIANPAALWLTVLTALPMLWLPIVQGILQGLQNFVWLGWTFILNGVGRFTMVLVTVVLLGGYAAAGMVGAVTGMLLALSVGLWQTRSVWAGPSAPVDWRPWLGNVIPLTLGLGASQFMFAADMVMVRTFFEGETGLYGAAGTLARGIVLFTGPLTMVMFPKIVQSAVRSEKTDVLTHALLATAALASAAALGLSLFPALPFRILNKPSYLPITPLIPWFAWAMVPLTLANVLLNNLLARSHFRVVPWAVACAGSYGIALLVFGKALQSGDRLNDFTSVVQILAVSNLALLAIVIHFTRQRLCPADRSGSS